MTGMKVRGREDWWNVLSDALQLIIFYPGRVLEAGLNGRAGRRPFFCKWTRLIPRAERYPGDLLVPVRPPFSPVFPLIYLSCSRSFLRRIPPATSPKSASTMQIPREGILIKLPRILPIRTIPQPTAPSQTRTRGYFRVRTSTDARLFRGADS